jgi:hypothetical protein
MAVFIVLYNDKMSQNGTVIYRPPNKKGRL